MLILNEKNFLEFASKGYRNPRCLDVKEFLDDLARVKYVKRLLNRYTRDNELQERLILNHLISIYNVFDISYANQILFFRCEPETWPALKTFLIYLSYLPENYMVDVRLDKTVMKRLRDL